MKSNFYFTTHQNHNSRAQVISAASRSLCLQKSFLIVFCVLVSPYLTFNKTIWMKRERNYTKTIAQNFFLLHGQGIRMLICRLSLCRFVIVTRAHEPPLNFHYPSKQIHIHSETACCVQCMYFSDRPSYTNTHFKNRLSRLATRLSFYCIYI